MGRRVVILAVALLVLAGCGGDGSGTAEAAAGKATTTTAPVTASTPDPLVRRAAVNKFVDAVRADQECSGAQCLEASALLARWSEIVSIAQTIPGDDVTAKRHELSAAMTAWLTCVSKAGGQVGPCTAQQDSLEGQFVALYDSLR